MDQLEIIEVCSRMAWHADRREWAELATVFADEVRLDYTSLGGGEPVTLSPEAIVSGWTAGLGVYTATHHLVSGHLVTVDGDTAVCTATFTATHLKTDKTLWTLGGTYRFGLSRGATGWRITGVVMTVVWETGQR